MSSYSFIDSTDNVVANGLPAEAVSINSVYVENAIEGYRTLYVKGRESLGIEINSVGVGSTDGERMKSQRYPVRVIKIGFQLIAQSNADFRAKFNHLNNFLSAGLDGADFVFNDENDKYFTGYPVFNAEVEPGSNAVTGEWEIRCLYPFKRSVAIKTELPDVVSGSTATFVIDYKGTQPARPILRAEFAGALQGGDYSDDGDCGFVAFTDGDGNIIQLGNPDVIDLDATSQAAQLINREFTTAEDWSTSGGASWGQKVVSGSLAANESISDPHWNNDAGQTLRYIKPGAYGTDTSHTHGPILWQATTGATNWELNVVHRLCVSDVNQVGTFEVGAYNDNEGELSMVAGIVIEKTGNGTAGKVKYIVGGKVVGEDIIDLSYYNDNFGYCNKWGIWTQQYYTVTVKKKVKGKKKKKKVKETRVRNVMTGYGYSQSNLNTSIVKEGKNITFDVGNLPTRTFNGKAVENVVAHNVSFHFGQIDAGTPMHTNAVHSVSFTRNAGPKFADTQNVFTANDVVEADCNSADIAIFKNGTVEGRLDPQYGALGNDWEDFVLKRGTNTILATWSPWINSNYKPTIKIIYNEVFI